MADRATFTLTALHALLTAAISFGTTTSTAAQEPPTSDAAEHSSDPDGTAANADEGAVSPQSAETPQGEDPEGSGEQNANDPNFGLGGGWFLNATLSTSLGLGTFVADPNARNPYFDYTIALQPGWLFNDGTALSLRVAWQQELTQSDIATRPRQGYISDTWLTAFRHLVTIPKAEIRTSGLMRVFLPTSRASRFETLVAGATVGLRFDRSIGPINIAWVPSFRKNFHRYTSPIVDNDERDLPMLLAREGGNEAVGAFLAAAGTNNMSHSLRNIVQLSAVIRSRFFLSATYLIDNAWTYECHDDGLVSPNATPGCGRRDGYFANVDFTWIVNGLLRLSTGVVTQGAPKSADNQRFRFPFFDFESPSTNATTFYLSATAMLDRSDFATQEEPHDE